MIKFTSFGNCSPTHPWLCLHTQKLKYKQAIEVQIHMKKRTHNYPRNRKPRDTSYGHSNQLIEKVGLESIKKKWIACGIYRTAWHFSCDELPITPWMIRHIVHKNHWQRPAENAPVILKGVLAGSMPASYYKSLDFSNITKKQKLNGV